MGISNGCITAVHIELEVDGDEHTLTLVLEGDKNIWEDFTLYADEEELITGSIEQTNNGFEAVFEDANGGDLLIIECDDKNGELTVSVDDGKFTVEYELTKKGGIFSFDTNDISCSIELSALEKVEKIDGAVDLLTLDEDELEEIFENIIEEIEG